MANYSLWTSPGIDLSEDPSNGRRLAALLIHGLIFQESLTLIDAHCVNCPPLRVALAEYPHLFEIFAAAEVKIARRQKLTSLLDLQSDLKGRRRYHSSHPEGALERTDDLRELDQLGVSDYDAEAAGRFYVDNLVLAFDQDYAKRRFVSVETFRVALVEALKKLKMENPLFGQGDVRRGVNRPAALDRILGEKNSLILDKMWKEFCNIENPIYDVAIPFRQNAGVTLTDQHRTASDVLRRPMLQFKKNTGLQMSLTDCYITETNLIALTASELLDLIAARKDWRGAIDELLKFQEGPVLNAKREQVKKLTLDFVKRVNARLKNVALRIGTLAWTDKMLLNVFSVEDAIGRQMRDAPETIIGLAIKATGWGAGGDFAPTIKALFGRPEIASISTAGDLIATHAAARRERVLYAMPDGRHPIAAELSVDHINDIVYFNQ